VSRFISGWNRLDMLWYSIVLLALPALVRSHSSHHAHDQEQFSQERLDELERKWGTDVSLFSQSVVYGLPLMVIVGLLWHFDLCPSSPHALLDPTADHLRHRYSRCTIRYCGILPTGCPLRSSSHPCRIVTPNILPWLQSTSEPQPVHVVGYNR
jgi:hypothetical protein